MQNQFLDFWDMVDFVLKILSEFAKLIQKR